MSMLDEIGWRFQEGRLFPFVPRGPGGAPRRALLLEEEVQQAITRVYQDREMEERMGQLEADLEVFADGRRIDPKYFSLLYPSGDGVWEIRSVRPDPQIRVLGLFAAKDVFIATNIAFRDDLGGWQSREWKTVKRAARAKWTQLFHSYQPVISTDVHSVVSRAINGRYFRVDP
jgi:hypothetical protein